MTVLVTHGKSAADCGYRPTDPRTTVQDLQRHLGLAEGHLAEVHRLLRALLGEVEEYVTQPLAS